MGLNPRNFEITGAALVQNLERDPAEFPKMIWPTNYCKLANQVAFTLFFAGKDFAPNAVINGENIDDFLQNCFLQAVLHFYKRIASETDLFDTSIFGIESMNEPNPTLIGYEDISVLPDAQRLRKGPTPTAFQAMVLGSGVACEVDVFQFNTFGPKKTGTTVLDPKGASAWIQNDKYDKKYGFQRDQGWELGRCLWAQNGVWDDHTNTLLRPDYFGFAPDDGQPIDESVFVNRYWTRFWNKFFFAMRELDKDIFLLAQPPIFAIPPDLRDTAFIDKHVIYAPHYYDGLTLVQKHWSNAWNIDMLGILRGRYTTPAFAIKVGSSAIRNCIRDQLKAIKQEGVERLGSRIPCLMSETGMPFDLDENKAYKSGDYSSQEDALDALGYALEGSQLHHTLWTYCSQNSHDVGDRWNGEDFSMFCGTREDKMPISTVFESSSSTSLSSESSDSSEYTLMNSSAKKNTELGKWSSLSGTRAEVAIARPYPVAVYGNFINFGYDLKARKFSMTIDADNCLQEDIGSEIVLPEFSFPEMEFVVSVSSGKWDFNMETRQLLWWHPGGEQTIEVTSQAAAPLSQTRQSYFGYICACCGLY